MFFYAPPGATILSARVNGKSVPVTSIPDGANSVARLSIDVPAASSGHAVAKPGSRQFVMKVRHGIAPIPVTTSALDCSAIK
jgi:hypothetical protein